MNAQELRNYVREMNRAISKAESEGLSVYYGDVYRRSNSGVWVLWKSLKEYAAENM